MIFRLPGMGRRSCLILPISRYTVFRGERFVAGVSGYDGCALRVL